MRSHLPLRSLTVLCALLIAPLAHAHEGHGVASHFAAGFLHPLSGLDHLLAMVLVGMWCWAKPRLGWVAPLLFMAGLILGAGLGLSGGLASKNLELFIALTLIVLGGMVGVMPLFKDHLWWRVGLVSIMGFGAVHGYMHGVELQSSLDLQGLAGMVCASACLHASGWWAGKRLILRHARLRAWTAMASMGTGGWLLAGLLASGGTP